MRPAAVVGVLVALAASPVAAYAQDPVRVGGSLRATAPAGGGSVLIELPEPFELGMDGDPDVPNAELRLSGGGGIRAAILREDRPGTWVHTHGVWDLDGAIGQALLTHQISRAGRYRLYVLGERAGTTAELVIHDRSGHAQVQAVGPARFTTRPWKVEPGAGGTTTVWDAVDNHGPAVYFGALTIERGNGTVQWCPDYGPEAGQASHYGPGCSNFPPEPLPAEWSRTHTWHSPGGSHIIGIGANLAVVNRPEIGGRVAHLSFEPATGALTPLPEGAGPPVGPSRVRVLGRSARVRRGRAAVRLHCPGPERCVVTARLVGAGAGSSATLEPGRTARLWLAVPGRRRRATLELLTAGGSWRVPLALRHRHRRVP